MTLKHTAIVCLTIIPLAGPLAAQSSTGKAPSTGPDQSKATTLELMRGPIKSSSDEVFKAAGEPPTSADGWTATQRQAQVLAETGKLLLVGSRVVDQGDWMKMTRAMIDAAGTAATAAGKKNDEALMTAGDAIYETCENCHAKYMKKE